MTKNTSILGSSRMAALAFLVMVALSAGASHAASSTAAPLAGTATPSFGPPSCAVDSADSTCFGSSTSSLCALPTKPASDRVACPAGYVGTMVKSGVRDMCTGTVTYSGSGGTNGCTNCGNPLNASENQAMLGATVEASERANLAFVNYMFPMFSYLDGASVKDPKTGNPIGRMFRDHVWVAPDGFSSGLLPTSNRIRYLQSQGQIPSNIPPSNLLPKDPNGNPINNSGELYLMALTAAQSSGYTTCSGDGQDGCNISCSAPTSGWQQAFCKTRSVSYYSCSDSYAVNNAGAWTPTASATVPYTSTSPHDYTAKSWDWPTIFGWNGLDNSGGNVFMCNDTIQACNGWVTQSSVYQCKTPGSFACSYTNPLDGSTVSTTCSTCDTTQGAVWDYLLTQSNDCPLAPGQSTRTNQTDQRSVWQGDLALTSCPINGVGTGGTVKTCPATQELQPDGVTCGCQTGYVLQGATCVNPTYTPPSTGNLITCQNGYSYSTLTSSCQPIGGVAVGPAPSCASPVYATLNPVAAAYGAQSNLNFQCMKDASGNVIDYTVTDIAPGYGGRLVGVGGYTTTGGGTCAANSPGTGFLIDSCHPGLPGSFAIYYTKGRSDIYYVTKIDNCSLQVTGPPSTEFNYVNIFYHDFVINFCN